MSMSFQRSTWTEPLPLIRNLDEKGHSVSLTVNGQAWAGSSELVVQTSLKHWMHDSKAVGVHSCFITGSMIGRLLRRWGFLFRIDVSWTRWPASSISEISHKDSKP